MDQTLPYVESLFNLILMETDGLRGQFLFQSMTDALGEYLDIDQAFISRFDPESDSHALTISRSLQGRPSDNIRYSLHDAPCSRTAIEGVCLFPDNICLLFPDNQALKSMRAASYLGVVLRDSGKRPVGVLALIDTKPMPDTLWLRTLVTLLARQISAEFEIATLQQQLGKTS